MEVHTKMKSVLITGAAGEVGLLLTKSFINEGIDVYGIDHVDRDHCEELAFLGRNALFHFDNHSLAQVDWNDYEPVDVIFHLAHQIPTGDGLAKLKETLNKNRQNMKNIVDYAAKSGAKVVLVSTTEVCGGNQSEDQLTDQSPSPKSLYGFFMLAEESFLQKAAADSAISYHILRSPRLSGSSHPIEKRCHAIDESEKAGISTHSRELNNGQTLLKETFVEVCMEILNGTREEQIIPLFNKS